MNLYLLTQPTRGYNTYDGVVVVADTPEAARLIHPRGDIRWDGRGWAYPRTEYEKPFYVEWDWAANPDEVTVTWLGTAAVKLVEGANPVILSSFHEG